MRTKVETITPEAAEHLLASAAGIAQRHISPRRVAMYAGAMKRGQWRITHQSIAIDEDGVLIDGQHRLSAVVVAGVPVQMTVARGVPRTVFDAIDAGVARTAASTLHIAGVADAAATAAAIRLLMTYESVAGTRRIGLSEMRSRITTIDTLNFIHSPRGETLAAALTSARHISASLSRQGMRSWMAAGITLIDESRPDLGLRSEFVEKLESGAMLAEGSPILTLRRWLVSEHGYQRTDRSDRGLFAIGALLKAWNAWLYGKNLSLIRIRPGKENWPLPGRDAEAEELFALAAEAVEEPEPIEIPAP